MSLLEVEGLNVGVAGSPHLLLREVAFDVGAGEILGIVGESGSGKTMASLAVIGLLPNGIEFRGGSVKLENRELAYAARASGRVSADISMIFQQPRSALNPTMRAGRQVARVLETNQGLSKADAKAQAVDMLRRVGIPGADRVARAYPHQLSGGMCQRVMIAMAMACRPRLLIADEPTTALDVTIQAQIFDLIRSLVDEIGCGVLFITHDLAAVAEMCDRVVVMYGGQIMERAGIADLLDGPEHPYTRYLLDAVDKEVDHRIVDVGVNFALKGCRFSHRCPHAHHACNELPPLYSLGDGHASACFLNKDGRVVAS
ncbi:MAG TPA: ABC transporter ATP-binding protein [Actinobacteria bacterium]|nr:ABC transporter ATP-binding protein [Actinomycetota bacterium]